MLQDLKATSVLLPPWAPLPVIPSDDVSEPDSSGGAHAIRWISTKEGGVPPLKSVLYSQIQREKQTKMTSTGSWGLVSFSLFLRFYPKTLLITIIASYLLQFIFAFSHLTDAFIQSDLHRKYN